MSRCSLVHCRHLTLFAAIVLLAAASLPRPEASPPETLRSLRAKVQL
jgi:hypothetical protein